MKRGRRRGIMIIIIIRGRRGRGIRRKIKRRRKKGRKK